MRLKACALQIIILIALVGCTYIQHETSCDKAIPLVSQDNNTVLQIDLPAHLNDFKIGSPLFIVASNMSNSRIQVIPDQDLKLFWLQDGTWTTVKNNDDYLGAIKSIATKSESDPGSRMYSADLDIAHQNDAIQVCIVLEGTTDIGGSRSKVVAFREVTLHP